MVCCKCLKQVKNIPFHKLKGKVGLSSQGHQDVSGAKVKITCQWESLPAQGPGGDCALGPALRHLPQGAQARREQGFGALFGSLFKWRQDTQLLQPGYLSQVHRNSQNRTGRKKSNFSSVSNKPDRVKTDRGCLEMNSPLPPAGL